MQERHNFSVDTITILCNAVLATGERPTYAHQPNRYEKQYSTTTFRITGIYYVDEERRMTLPYLNNARERSIFRPRVYDSIIIKDHTAHRVVFSLDSQDKSKEGLVLVDGAWKEQLLNTFFYSLRN